MRLLNFNNSNIQTLQQGAFRFLPKLTDLKLTYNNIKQIPENVFNNLNVRRLYLDDNILEEIATGAFKNMRKLLEFRGSNNNLVHYNPDWFVDSHELRLIDLRNNKLRNIPTKAFMNNNKLKTLLLDSNDIAIVQDDAFKGLKSLDYLSLSRNKLKYLYSKAFPKSFAIRTFNLNANQFNYLPQDLLKELYVYNIDVTGNPWKCACLGNIREWIKSRKGLVKSYCSGSPVPTCGFQEISPDRCTEHYDDEFTSTFYKTFVLGKSIPSECLNI